MLTENYANWCGYEHNKEMKDVEGYALMSRPENLLVLMPPSDYDDMKLLLGSEAKGPFTEQFGLVQKIKEYQEMGVRFYR